MNPRALSGAVCIAALAAATAAAADSDTKRITVGFSAELNGQFGIPDCHADKLRGRNLGHLAASVEEARRTAEADGRRFIAAVHLGDFIGAGALARFLADTPGGTTELAQFIARSGFTHAVAGRGWFSYPASTLGPLTSALPAGAPVFLNATLSCEGRPDCDWLNKAPPRVMLDADGEKIALIGGTSEYVTRQLNASLMKGITFKPLAKTLSDQAEAARKDGASIVIAAVHWAGDRGGYGAFENMLHDVSGVDVFLVDDLGDFRLLSGMLHGSGNTTIAIAGRTPTEALALDIDFTHEGEQTVVTQTGLHRYAAPKADPALENELDDVEQRFCKAWHEPLPVRASPPVDRATFLLFTLDQLRSAADAEVAIANESMLAGAAFPIDGPITTADVYSAVRFDDTIMRTRVKGSWLRQLRDKAIDRRKIKGRPSILWTGMEEKCGKLKPDEKCDRILINGRTLNDDYEYTIAVPDFLAAGGDDWIEQGIQFDPAERDGHALTVREVVLAALRQARPGQLLRDLPRPALDRRPHWTYSVGLTLGASDSRALNPANYQRHQFEVLNPGTDLNGELSGRVDADTLDHAFRLTERLYYDWNNSPSDNVTEVQEFLEALYQFRRPWQRFDQAWYVPVPYAGAHITMEYADAKEIPERLLEPGGDVGIRIIPVENLELKLAAGVRRDVLQSTIPTLVGGVFGWDVPRFSPHIFGGNQLDVETSVDGFLAPWKGGTYKEVALRLRLLFPLFTMLSLSVGYDMYLFQEPAQPLGLYSNFTFGLTARAGGARQQF